MRVISNRSTGELGQQIAKDLSRAGAKITVLEGPVAEPLRQKGITTKKFYFYDELAALLKSELTHRWDAVIHAAAVADFRPANKLPAKIPSGRRLALTLVPTKKLISRVKRMAPGSFLVGFKLESSDDEEGLLRASAKLFKEADCDLVVANALNPSYRAFLLSKERKIVARVHSRQAIAKKIVQHLREVL